MATIRYFIPEDGDSEEHPNVFLTQKPRQNGQPPLLRDIKSNFPLPGKYHFRFKTSPIPSGEHYGKGNNMAVWMDCVDENRPVPIWRNSIIAKVMRTSAEDDDDDVGFEYEAPVQEINGKSRVNHVPQPVHPPAQTAQGGHRMVSPQPPQPVPAQPEENLLFGFDQTPAAPTPTPNTSAGSLLDFGGATHASAARERIGSGGPHEDLLAMGMSPMPPIPQQHVQRAETYAPHMAPMPATPAQRYASDPHQVRAAQPPTPNTTQRYANDPHQVRAAQPPTPNTNAFETFTGNNDSFGGLNWS